MDAQLVLIETEPDDWHLDEETRTIGRQGVEQAREALRSARARAVRAECDAA